MKGFITFVELRRLFPHKTFVYAWIVPLWADQLLINPYHSFLFSNSILCLYNVDILNICMKEFIIFACTDSTETSFQN